MEHKTITAQGASFHVAVAGSGPPLLLLHGWPEYWRTWEPVMERLANRFTLIVPDLRGFSASSKPAGPWGAGDTCRRPAGIAERYGRGPGGRGRP